MPNFSSISTTAFLIAGSRPPATTRAVRVTAKGWLELKRHLALEKAALTEIGEFR